MLIDDLKGSMATRRPDAQWMMNHLKRAKVVKAFEVGERIHQLSPMERAKLVRDTVNIAPVFPSLWFEWRSYVLANRPWSEMKSETSRRMGILLVSVDAKDAMGFLPNGLVSDDELKDFLPESRWVTFGAFVRDMDGRMFDCPPALLWGVTAEGKPYFPKNTLSFVCHPFFGRRELTEDKDGAFARRIMWQLSIPFFALSLLHCRNIRLQEGPAHPEKLQRSRIRKGREPLVRWHTLVIDPMSKKRSGLSPSQSPALSMSLHICRGHFKVFNEKGLFGKLHGPYWWNPRTRGSSRAGVVLKDYDVKAPENPEQVLPASALVTTNGQ